MGSTYSYEFISAFILQALSRTEQEQNYALSHLAQLLIYHNALMSLLMVMKISEFLHA